MARLGQTNAHHQWGVATIVAQLHPDPSAWLIMAALWHDTGESVSGDTPYTAKVDNPDLANELKKVENAAYLRLTGLGFALKEEDRVWLKMADMIEAYLYVQTLKPHILSEEKWIIYLDAIFDMAEELEVYDEVAGLME